jgi:hypothetical protein
MRFLSWLNVHTDVFSIVIILPNSRVKNGLFRTLVDKSNLKLGDIITLLGGPLWTVPELSFEKKKLIPEIQQLLIG